MPFRLAAKNFFITYPQCPLSRETILAHLQTLLPGATFIKVCQEHHEDGALHLHCLCCLDKKKDIRNARFFDIQQYHPNVQAAKDIPGSIRYLEKEDTNSLSFGEAPAVKRQWSEILDASSKDEAMAIASQVSARDFVINHERIEYFVNKKFKPQLPEYVPRYTFTSVPTIIDVWMEQLSSDRPKSLVIWGPSRLGKTELARSLGPHMYFNGLFNLDEWDDGAKYAIFDDWEDWTKLFQWKQWIGAQQQFAVTDKYRKKRTVQWGKPCIILSNHEPIFPDMEWLNANVFKLHVINKLF